MLSSVTRIQTSVLLSAHQMTLATARVGSKAVTYVTTKLSRFAVGEVIITAWVKNDWVRHAADRKTTTPTQSPVVVPDWYTYRGWNVVEVVLTIQLKNCVISKIVSYHGKNQ